ncbi:hypothetical protein F4775DRAFT_444011 [Biscogniauxia sp. FL1348]|nr:hypothetical protein F4775DRAFT_444011 [Biscogniauxia sp. FL1348]
MHMVCDRFPWLGFIGPSSSSLVWARVEEILDRLGGNRGPRKSQRTSERIGERSGQARQVPLYHAYQAREEPASRALRPPIGATPAGIGGLEGQEEREREDDPRTPSLKQLTQDLVLDQNARSEPFCC